MATTTPNYGWPVPTSTDYVKDGATAIEALGDAIDATVAGLPSGALVYLTGSTFTTQSTVIFDSVFNSTYDNYKVLISLTAASGGDVGIGYYYRSGSPAADTTTGYFAQYTRSTGGTASGAYESLGLVGLVSNTYANYTNIDCTIFGANLANVSTIVALGQYVTNSGNPYQNSFATHQIATTQYTGIKFFPTSGTFSGTIRIYGIKKA
jgi:hypothetical protein